MCFGTFYDAEGAVFDTVQFPFATEKFPLHSKGIYLCRGKVVDELGYISVSVNWLERQETLGDPRFVNNSKKGFVKLKEDGNGMILK